MMKKSKKEEKIQISLRLEKSMVRHLKMVSRERSATMTSIIEASLEEFFKEKSFDELYLSHLDKVSRRVGKVEKNQQLMLETLARFASIYFANTPEVPADKKAQASQLGQARFNKFKEMVSDGMVGAKGIRKPLNEIVFDDEEFEEKYL